MSKSETNSNTEMGETSRGERAFDLEERTYEFAKDVRRFVKLLPRTIGNMEDVKQLVRSSGSVGANYIEANEALSKRDFALRIKIARKEAKESTYWLRLLDVGDRKSTAEEREILVRESVALMKILGSIYRKTEPQR